MTTVALTAPALLLHAAEQQPRASRATAAAAKDSAQPQALASASDEALFAQALQQHEPALETLIQRYTQPLFGLLVRLTQGDAHRADDLFQETFLHALRRGETFRPEMRFKPWLTTIAVNVFRDDKRRRTVRSEVALENTSETGEACGPLASLPDGGPPPGAALESSDDATQIRAALSGLTDVEREVILLHFYQGLTLVEAASALEIPVGTVKSRLHAALTRLQGLLRRFKPER